MYGDVHGVCRGAPRSGVGIGLRGVSRIAGCSRRDPSNLTMLYGILDDRDRPYYEHRLAA